jgi:hypothetical protein
MERALREWSRRVAWLVMSRGGVLLGWVVLMMEILRETPAFWTNAGGYPVWMRTATRELFYPLLFLESATLAGLVWLLLDLPPRPMTAVRRQLSWIAAVALLLLVTVLIGIWDE